MTPDTNPEDEDDFASILAKGISKRIQLQESRLRQAWEAGFALCASYGDNKHHFCGEQKENQWQKLLDSIKHQ